MAKKNHPNFDMLKSFLDFLREEDYTLLVIAHLIQVKIGGKLHQGREIE